MAEITELVKIRRKVFTELARLAFEGSLSTQVESVLTTVVTEDGPRHRCCVHKERAVLKDRINLALSQPMGTKLEDAVKQVLEGEKNNMPVINVMPEACDQCPLDKFLVTDACRNCVAHHCIASCPKKAITVLYNRAYIDKTKCVECGLCKKSCPYGAIIEISRPCERACSLAAITAGNDRRAKIDYELCVQCGACKNACPFGAIGERSSFVYLINEIKAQKRVYAMVAPAIIGQFGVKVSIAQIRKAMKKLGFYDMVEVSLAADVVSLEETKEFAATVPKERPWMTTSCCPAFVGMVEKHLPDLKSHVSTTVSPMAAMAKIIKAQDPDSVVVFIGPCTAKKAEGEKYQEIDYVLTFEELAALMVGGKVNVSEQEEEGFVTTASSAGNGFAKAGGVMQAVLETAAAVAPDIEVKPHRAEGLSACKMALIQLQHGKIDANFFEGMACEGGCVGGPGAITDCRLTGKLVEIFAKTAPTKAPQDNKMALEHQGKDIHWHRD